MTELPMKFYQIIQEGMRLAFQSLRANTLRSVLSLLGITLGIFSIISIFAFVDSMSKSLTESIQSVGSDVVYVQKMSWGGEDGEFKWWKYFQRPEPSVDEMKKLQRRMTHAKAVAYIAGISGNLNYRNNITEGVTLVGVTHEYDQIWDIVIEQGRYFSPLESNNRRAVAILGSDVSDGLFGTDNPIGKEIRILGEKVTVIGVLQKEGSKMFGDSHDNRVVLPASFMLRKVNEHQLHQTSIMVKAKDGVSLDQLKDELRGYLRGIRRLRPIAEDNFSLNEISVLQNGVAAMFDGIWLGGIVIGGFSLLAGGFGIANIMFVSVSERMGQIGIQKALGARANFIMYQFLSEATILSVVGGIIGLFFSWLVILIVDAAFEDFNLILSTQNIIIGILVSAFIGAVFGLIPAINASKKDPVEAIRANM